MRWRWPGDDDFWQGDGDDWPRPGIIILAMVMATLLVYAVVSEIWWRLTTG